MDRRQRKSRAAITGAFRELLAQKKYQSITVQNIIDRADVSRSTFYAHFETKEDLLKGMCTELFDHVVKDHGSAEDTHDFSRDPDGADTIIAHILYHIRDNTNNIAAVLRSDSGEILVGYMKEYLKDTFRDELAGNLKDIGVPEDYVLNHVASSFVDMIHWWLRNGQRQTPEELEAWYLQVMAAVLE